MEKTTYFTHQSIRAPVTLSLRRGLLRFSPEQLRSDIHEGFVNGSHQTPPLFRLLGRYCLHHSFFSVTQYYTERKAFCQYPYIKNILTLIY